MIVAFIAVKADRQKQVCRILHRIFGSTMNLEIRSSRHFLVRTRSRKNVVHKLVVRHILINRFADPVMEQLRSFCSQVLAIDLQQVSPFVRPVFDIFFTAQ